MMIVWVWKLYRRTVVLYVPRCSELPHTEIMAQTMQQQTFIFTMYKSDCCPVHKFYL